jgi:hypothetical protein
MQLSEIAKSVEQFVADHVSALRQLVELVPRLEQLVVDVENAVKPANANAVKPANAAPAAEATVVPGAPASAATTETPAPPWAPPPPATT